MLNFLIELDIALIEWIHQNLHTTWLDAFVPYLRNKYTWIPVYVFIVAFMLINHKLKGLVWVIMVIGIIALADGISTKGLKRNVKRLRPCHNTEVVAQLDVIVPCGGKYGFVSSHAANHFGISFFIFYTLGRVYRRIKWPALLWALVVSLAQIYVGVHYPLDILGGALLGWGLAGLFAWYFNRRWDLSVDRKKQDVIHSTTQT